VHDPTQPPPEERPASPPPLDPGPQPPAAPEWTLHASPEDAGFLLPGFRAPEEGGLRRIAARDVGVGAALVVLAGVVAGVFGQLGNFIVGAIEVTPFALIALLAFAGRRHTWATVLAHVGNLAILGLIALFSLLLLAIALGDRGGAAGWWVPYLVFAAWSIAGLLAAILLPLPAVQARLATFLPIRADHTAHGVALGLVVGMTLIAFGQLVASGGRPALLTLVQRDPGTFAQMEGNDLTGSIILSFLWTVPGTIIAAGWPLVRSFPQALERLGFVRPTLRQVLGGLVIAGAMVAVFQGLDAGLTALWNLTGWPKTDVKAFEQLLKPLITPQGAVIIGITAGVGEELLVRGVLQPRLGILLSNLFFTSLHAFQYGFDGLLSVFAAGLVLGVVRARTNTSTSAIVHGTYDFILVLTAALTGGLAE